MKSKSVEVKPTTSLLQLVKQRIQLKRDEDERKRKAQDSFVHIPHLPEGCIFNIIVRLPLESLSSTRFVSKSWYGIVDNPSFVNAHLQRSDTGLIFLTPARKDTKINFLVESMATGHDRSLFDTPPLYQINFMQIKDGKSTIIESNVTCMGTIRTACNGLIVLEHRLRKGPWGVGGLILLNPVTRELKVIPMGTKSNCHGSYGLAFCEASRQYKIVHLFKNYLNYIECEIMEIGSGGPWRAVEGPPNGYLHSLCDPVLAMGALHWLPTYGRNEYMVSMTLADEKFKVIAAPKSGLKWIFAMGEFLGLLGACQEAKRMDVWVLRGNMGSWEKQYSIDVSGITGVAVHSLYYGRAEGELVFRGSDDHMYVYDHYHSPHLRKIEKCPSAYGSSFCAHVSTLISCRSL